MRMTKPKRPLPTMLACRYSTYSLQLLLRWGTPPILLTSRWLRTTDCYRQIRRLDSGKKTLKARQTTSTTRTRFTLRTRGKSTSIESAGNKILPHQTLGTALKQLQLPYQRRLLDEGSHLLNRNRNPTQNLTRNQSLRPRLIESCPLGQLYDPRMKDQPAVCSRSRPLSHLR